jgi:hypothetical protein
VGKNLPTLHVCQVNFGLVFLPSLPMQLQIGDRYADEAGEWELVNRPVSFRGGKSVRGARSRAGARSAGDRARGRLGGPPADHGATGVNLGTTQGRFWYSRRRRNRS